MEHDPGSGLDPAAASSMPDQQPSPQSSASGEPAEPAEPADPAEPDEPAEPDIPDELARLEASADADDQPGHASQRELAATGEPRVDAALGRLGELHELPVAEHPGVYERVHEQLVEVLGDLHSGGQKS